MKDSLSMSKRNYRNRRGLRTVQPIQGYQQICKPKKSFPLVKAQEEKIKGPGRIWETSIDMDHRITFEKVKDSIRLRVIGKHNVLDR